jgi:hypothetical protein
MVKNITKMLPPLEKNGEKLTQGCTGSARQIYGSLLLQTD